MHREIETENWRVIVENPRYMVSDIGRVMNKKRGNMLTPIDNGNGYFKVGISSDGIETKKYVHILVAEAFIPNPEGLPEVDHINRNPENNKVSNLRWVTRSQQMANTKSHIDSTSSCKGVSWKKKSGKWQAQISIAGKDFHLGLYVSEAEASCVYDWFALLLYKKFAKLNTKFKRNYPPELLNKIFALMEHHNFQL